MPTTFHSVSAANYLIYNITDELGAGARAEWAKINGVSYYETTVGVNIKPTGNLVIRPEIRHQWSPAGQKVTTRLVCRLTKRSSVWTPSCRSSPNDSHA